MLLRTLKSPFSGSPPDFAQRKKAEQGARNRWHERENRPEQERFIVLFSDMVGDYSKACDTSHFELDLKGIHVIAANVIKSDPGDPKKYFDLLAEWEATVVAAGGKWSLVTSPDLLPKLVTGI